MDDAPKEPTQTTINADVNVGEQQGGSVSGVGIENFQSGVTHIYTSAGIWVLGVISVIAVVGLLWITMSLLNRGNPPAAVISAGTTEPAAAVFNSPTATQVTPTGASPAVSQEIAPSTTVEATQTPTPTRLLEPSATSTPDLSSGCLQQDVWTPYLGEAHPVDSFGCWDLEDWGIQAISGGLSVRASGSGAGTLRGIYRPLKPYSRIDLELKISRMGTVGDLEPKLMFGILPSTLRSKDNGKYLSYQRESIAQDFLYIKLNDGTLDRGQYLPLRYTPGESQRVTLIARDNEFSIYINGDQVGDPIRITYKINYFWIGYDLPPGTSLEAELLDVSVRDL